MAAGAGVGEVGLSHGPAVCHVLLPPCAPSSAVGLALGGLPRPGVFEILTLLSENYRAEPLVSRL